MMCRPADSGITVCERWINSFENFLNDMGEKPEGLSLDRIDNNKGYSPENCRWATSKTQCRNHRGCTFIEYQGKKQTIIEWSEETGISKNTIWARYIKKLPLDMVFLNKRILPTLADKRNKTGLLGVYQVRNKYIAQITINRKVIYLGIYDTPELASEAYIKAKTNSNVRKLKQLNAEKG